MARTKILEVRPYYRIKVSDLESLSDEDFVVIEVRSPEPDKIKVKVKHIRDRYERGVGVPGGKPSIDWINNGEHKSTKGIPVWLKKVAITKKREKVNQSFKKGKANKVDQDISRSKKKSPNSTFFQSKLNPDTEMLEFAKKLLGSGSIRSIEVEAESDWSNFKKSSEFKQWVYLYAWGEPVDVIAWGTCSNTSDRIRKASIFNSKLTGKYDRRGDYLMLKRIYGMPKVWVYEVEGDAKVLEASLKDEFNNQSSTFQENCFRGISGNRDQITRIIFKNLKETSFWTNLAVEDTKVFNEFINEIYLAKIRHPDNTRRTFFYGDCLEPGFLNKIDKAYMIPVVERVLSVSF